MNTNLHLRAAFVRLALTALKSLDVQGRIRVNCTSSISEIERQHLILGTVPFLTLEAQHLGNTLCLWLDLENPNFAISIGVPSVLAELVAVAEKFLREFKRQTRQARPVMRQRFRKVMTLAKLGVNGKGRNHPKSTSFRRFGQSLAKV